jgi:hypothetical protein
MARGYLLWNKDINGSIDPAGEGRELVKLYCLMGLGRMKNQ